MRVLVVHDRAEVATRIKQIAVGCGVDAERIVVVADGTSARRELSRQMFDLLILDLTLPHIHGRDSPTYQVADQLLKEMFLLDDLKTPSDIIGITQDETTLNRVGAEFGSHVMTVIAEDPPREWEGKLGQKISYTIKVAVGRQTAINSQFEYDCVLITALDKEMRPYRDAFEFSDYEPYPGVSTFLFTSSDEVSRRGAAFAIGKSGEARAASYTQMLLSLFRPRLLLMTGICGGVSGKTELGDVVIAESALDWDYGKWNESAAAKDAPDEVQPSPRFSSRPDPVSIEGSRAHRLAREILESDLLKQPELLKRVKEISFGLIEKPTAHLAPMASGSSVIASDAILKDVCRLNDSIRGVDMECFGVYQAASTTHVVHPEFVCIKTVSDFSNGMKDDRYHPGACALSAFIGIEILTELWDFRR